MRTSRPFARACSSVPLFPGTRIRSPKVAIVTSFKSINESITEEGVTHTGQPGPEINEIDFGNSLRIPQ